MCSLNVLLMRAPAEIQIHQHATRPLKEHRVVRVRVRVRVRVGVRVRVREFKPLCSS